MRLDFAFLCDYADASGKVHALGIGVDNIYAPQVPARHQQFTTICCPQYVSHARSEHWSKLRASWSREIVLPVKR